MKFTSLKENHLFSKAYSSRQRMVTHTVAVYVLKDRHEKNGKPAKREHKPRGRLCLKKDRRRSGKKPGEEGNKRSV